MDIRSGVELETTLCEGCGFRHRTFEVTLANDEKITVAKLCKKNKGLGGSL